MDFAMNVLSAAWTVKQRLNLAQDNVSAWQELKPRVQALVQLLQKRSVDSAGCSAWVNQHLSSFQSLQSDLTFALSKIDKWIRRQESTRGKLYALIRASKVQGQVQQLSARLDRCLLELAVTGIDALATGVDGVAAGVSGIASSAETISAGVFATSDAVRSIEERVGDAHANVAGMRRSFGTKLEGIAQALGDNSDKLDSALETGGKAARRMERLKRVIPSKYHSVLFSSAAAAGSSSGHGRRFSVISRATNTVTASGTATVTEETQLDVFASSSSSSASSSAPADTLAGQRMKRIDWSELTFEGPGLGQDDASHVVGRGGNGAVLRARWGSTPVAVKVLWLSLEGGREPRDVVSSFLSEALAAWDMVHPRINPVLALAVDNSDTAHPQFGLVMQYAAGGSLRSVLDDRARLRLPLARRLTWLVQIVEGLEYMHRLGKVHGDLKAANMLLDDKGDASLCDFGFTSVSGLRVKGSTGTGPGTGTGAAGTAARLAAVGQDGRYASSGSLLWRAPEQFYDPELGGPAVPSQASDVYAFGITAWEVLTRGMPWIPQQATIGTGPGFATDGPKLPTGPELTRFVKSLPGRVLSGERPDMHTMSAFLQHPLADIIQQCWHEDAASRPGMAEVLVVLKRLLDKVLADLPNRMKAIKPQPFDPDLPPPAEFDVLEVEGLLVDIKDFALGGTTARVQRDLVGDVSVPVRVPVASTCDGEQGSKHTTAVRPAKYRPRSGSGSQGTADMDVVLVPLKDGSRLLLLSKLTSLSCGNCRHCKATPLATAGSCPTPHPGLAYPLGFTALPNSTATVTDTDNKADYGCTIHVVLPVPQAVPLRSLLPLRMDRDDPGNGHLYDPGQYVRDIADTFAGQEQRLVVVEQVADAMAHVHSLGICGGWTDPEAQAFRRHKWLRPSELQDDVLLGRDGRAVLRLADTAHWYETQVSALHDDLLSTDLTATALPTFRSLASGVPPNATGQESVVDDTTQLAITAFSLLSHRLWGEPSYVLAQWMWSFNEHGPHGSVTSDAYWASKNVLTEDMLPPTVDGRVRQGMRAVLGDGEDAPSFPWQWELAVADGCPAGQAPLRPAQTTASRTSRVPAPWTES